MRINRTLACALLGLGLAVAGCEKSETTTPSSGGGTAATPAASPSAAAPSTPATPAAPAETASTSTTPESATAAAQSAANSAAQSAQAAGQSALQSAQTGAQNAAQTAAGTASPTTAPSAATPEVQQAQTLLNQTVEYIKANKMDLADKSLTQLEALKPKLPVEYQSKIDSARKAFNAAKSGQGLNGLLPGSAK